MTDQELIADIKRRLAALGGNKAALARAIGCHRIDIHNALKRDQVRPGLRRALGAKAAPEPTPAAAPEPTPAAAPEPTPAAAPDSPEPPRVDSAFLPSSLGKPGGPGDPFLLPALAAAAGMMIGGPIVAGLAGLGAWLAKGLFDEQASGAALIASTDPPVDAGPEPSQPAPPHAFTPREPNREGVPSPLTYKDALP